MLRQEELNRLRDENRLLSSLLAGKEADKQPRVDPKAIQLHQNDIEALKKELQSVEKALEEQKVLLAKQKEDADQRQKDLQRQAAELAKLKRGPVRLGDTKAGEHAEPWKGEDAEQVDLDNPDLVNVDQEDAELRLIAQNAADEKAEFERNEKLLKERESKKKTLELQQKRDQAERERLNRIVLEEQEKQRRQQEEDQRALKRQQQELEERVQREQLKKEAAENERKKQELLTKLKEKEQRQSELQAHLDGLPQASDSHLLAQRIDLGKLGPKNARQEATVRAFKWAWDAYKRCSWGQDELSPISCHGMSLFGSCKRF